MFVSDARKTVEKMRKSKRKQCPNFKKKNLHKIPSTITDIFHFMIVEKKNKLFLPVSGKSN